MKNFEQCSKRRLTMTVHTNTWLHLVFQIHLIKYVFEVGLACQVHS